MFSCCHTSCQQTARLAVCTHPSLHLSQDLLSS